MKVNFDDMSDAEIAALTSEEICRIIDRTCAERGIQLAPRKPQEPKHPGHLKDATVYSIQEQFCFTDPYEAASAVEFLTKLSLVDLGYSGSFRGRFISRPVFSLTINSQPVFTGEKQGKIKAEMEEYSKNLTEYEGELQDYKKIMDKRIVVEREIMDHLFYACERELGRQGLRDNFLTYLKIAEGNRDIAFAFFDKAYGSNGNFSDVYNDIVDEIRTEAFWSVPLDDDAECSGAYSV